VVYLENHIGNVYLENLDHVKAYKSVIENFSRRALTTEESKVFLTKLADEYGPQTG
jgi:hypothetical protein